MDREAPGNAGNAGNAGKLDIPRWDSLGRATLACTLERAFNIRFNTDELTALENVREIIRVVGLKLGGPAA